MSDYNKEKLIKLRKMGLSYGEIQELVDISKGALSYLVGDIELTKKQEKRLHEKEKRNHEMFSKKVKEGKIKPPNPSEETKRKIANGVLESCKERGDKINKPKTDVSSFMALNGRSRKKVIKRMRKDGLINGCFVCGWDKTSCDIHHIKGRNIKNPHKLENLTYLCPNHHRLADRGILEEDDLETFAAKVGNKWKNYYYALESKR